jgi:hypothetical protein
LREKPVLSAMFMGRNAMLRRTIESGLAAVAFVIGMNTADAGVVKPNSVLSGSVQASVANAGWVCEERRCFWRQDYAGPVPPYAAAWGPPDYPTCYYIKRRISKRWRQICPEVPWQAR